MAGVRRSGRGRVRCCVVAVVRCAPVWRLDTGAERRSAAQLGRGRLAAGGEEAAGRGRGESSALGAAPGLRILRPLLLRGVPRRRSEERRVGKGRVTEYSMT